MFLFTLLLSTLAGLISGVIPALSMSRQNPAAILKEVGRSASAGPRRQRAHSLLVISEIALAVVLVIAAGLLTKSFLLLKRVDPGVNPANLLTLQLSLSAAHIGRSRVRADSRDRRPPALAPRRARRGGGLDTAADRLGLHQRGLRAGRDHVGTDVCQVSHKEISPEYFPTLGVKLLRGRGFSPVDDERSPRVAMVNEALVRHLFPNVSPLGQRLAFGRKAAAPADWVTVVGVGAT